MKVDETSLIDWLTQVRNSQVALPRFQRHEEWTKGIIENFLTSVVRDLPTGASLVYIVRGESPFDYRYLEGAPKDSQDEPNELILDGQQRLTAIWKSLNDLYEERKYLLDLNDDSKLKVTSKKRYTKKGKEGLYPLWVDDPERCWDRKKVPIHMLNPDKKTSELREWCKNATNGEDYEEVFDKIFEVRDKIRDFTFPKLRLENHTDPSNAIDVFIKLNTSYLSLSPFDIVVAKTEAATKKSLHNKMSELLSAAPEIEDYKDPEKMSLNALSLLQGKRPTKTVKEEKLNYVKVIDDWDKVITGTEKLVSFLEQEKIFNGKILPTNVILGPLVALFSEVPTHPDERGNARRLLKKYLWRSFFTDRYETTTNTRIYEDYTALRKRLRGEDVDVPIFDEEEYPIPSKEELKDAGWPTKKNRLGRAILCLSFQYGARNFADDYEITKKNIEKREYHHLYPQDYLKKSGYEEEDTNKALNCALILWKDNRSISNKNPLEYLLERSNADNMGESQVRKRLKSHLVDYDAMTKEDYKYFLEKRSKVVREQAKRLCHGKEIDKTVKL